MCVSVFILVSGFFFFKEKTAYEMRISDWSSDVCSSDLLVGQIFVVFAIVIAGVWAATQWCAAQLGYQAQLGPAWFMAGDMPVYRQIGRASCRERVCQYV